MLWRGSRCGREMGELRFGSLSERSIMHRHASQHTPSIGRRLRVRSGAGLIGYLWMIGYVSVVLGALFSTVFFPDILSMLRSQRSSMQSHMLYQRGDHGVQPRSDELNLRQESGSQRLSQLPSPGVESVEFKKLWKPPPNRGFHPCVEPSESYSGPGISRGYLLVQSNGGLNQMRAGICDMVAVARILNATLVVPELDKRSFWQDSRALEGTKSLFEVGAGNCNKRCNCDSGVADIRRNFSDIFDVDHFIEALRGDVHVVKSLPQEYLLAPKAVKQFQSWSNVKYYVDIIAPVWRDYKVIRASKSDSRLANNDLPADIQKLRCRVHYDALRFSRAIDEFGKKLVERLRTNGPYIALHLRYEKDMLAFSGCTHGLTHKEADELTLIRQTTAHWKVKDINSTDQRVKGYCPLTPKEVGVFLKALGYPETTPIYIAAGEIYGGDERMKGLLSRFPNVLRKAQLYALEYPCMCKSLPGEAFLELLLPLQETVATPEELAPFVNHSSQLAALDYIVSVESNVFVPSYSGNMARAVEGHRRYLEHRKTITPDRKELVALFDKLDRGELTEGLELAEMITNIHKRRQGAPRKRKGPITGTKGRDRFRTEEAFYTNPLPDCLCSETDPINSKPKIFNTDRQLLSHDPQWRDGLSSWQRH